MSGLIASLFLRLDTGASIILIIALPLGLFLSAFLMYAGISYLSVVYSRFLLNLRRSLQVPVVRDLPSFTYLCVILSVSFFTILSLLPPQQLFSAVIVVPGIDEIGKWVTDAQTGSPSSLVNLLGLLLYPVVGPAVIGSIRVYRIMMLYQGITVKDEVNSPLEDLVKFLPIVTFVAPIVVLGSTVSGVAPSGVSLQDYLVLLLIIAPSSVFVASLAEFTQFNLERGLEERFEILTLIQLEDALLPEGHLREVAEGGSVVRISFEEHEMLKTLGVTARPENWSGPRTRLQTFTILSPEEALKLIRASLEVAQRARW